MLSRLEHIRGWTPLRSALPLSGGVLSVQAISWVLEESEATLGSRLTLIAVANHAKSDGTGAWPKVETIASEAKLSEREVRYCLRTLEESGELSTQIGQGPHGTNMYSLPKMRGAKFAPEKITRGQSTTQKTTEGGNLRHSGGQPIAPEPSLTVLKENRPTEKAKPLSPLPVENKKPSKGEMTPSEIAAAIRQLASKKAM